MLLAFVLFCICVYVFGLCCCGVCVGVGLFCCVVGLCFVWYFDLGCDVVVALISQC